MSKEEVLHLQRLQKPGLACGIYFLLRGDDVVYIGQSVSILSRVLQHTKEQKKDFDEYCFIECDTMDLDKTEAFLIAKFDPEYNATMPPGYGYLSAHQWTHFFKIPPSLILQFAQQTSLLPSKKWYSKDEMTVFEDFMRVCFGKNWMTSRKRLDFSNMEERITSFLNR